MSCFYKCNKYNIKKYETQQQAIEWQKDFENQNCSWDDLLTWQTYFEKKAKRYGLLREFRENGII